MIRHKFNNRGRLHGPASVSTHSNAPGRGAGIETDIAPRPSTLDGLHVGLVWNRKRGGDAILEQVGTMLQDRFADIKLTTYQGSIPTPAEMLDRWGRSVTSSSAPRATEGSARRGLSTT